MWASRARYSMARMLWEEPQVANAVPTVLPVGHKTAPGTLRVAAYCRVSTEKEDQLNSLAAQRRFFQAYIAEHPGWSLVRVFADEGLSGTSVKRRPAFSEMLRLALGGGLDLIVTKEVSRFARNTVDTLQVTRQLKEKGVAVLFLNDGIDTRDNDGEFRLTIMASVAQEESRKISERTRWGQLQAMKRGVVFGNRSLYGYSLRDGRLAVRPEEAEVVRSVYRSFLGEGKGAHTIARELTESGVRPPLRPSGAWSSAMVLRLLKNEKYCGDLLQKKYRTADYLSHRKLPNRGEEEQILLRDHHEAIVSREQFEAAQAELARRGAAADRSRFSSRYWYSGKVRCGCCGRSFVVKRTRRANGAEYLRFVCRGRLEGGCRMRAVRGEVIFACARRVLWELALDGGAVVEELVRALGTPGEARGGDGAGRLRQALRRQTDRRDRALEAFLDGDLGPGDMRRAVSRCESEMERLRGQLEALEARRREAETGPARFAAFYERLERELTGGEAVLDETMERITVYEDRFAVSVAEIPVCFRVRAQWRGRGQNGGVVISECEAEQAGGEAAGDGSEPVPP